MYYSSSVGASDSFWKLSSWNYSALDVFILYWNQNQTAHFSFLGEILPQKVQIWQNNNGIVIQIIFSAKFWLRIPEKRQYCIDFSSLPYFGFKAEHNLISRSSIIPSEICNSWMLLSPVRLFACGPAVIQIILNNQTDPNDWNSVNSVNNSNKIPVLCWSFVLWHCQSPCAGNVIHRMP